MSGLNQTQDASRARRILVRGSLIALLLALAPLTSHAVTIVGLGNSITCMACNDGSYLGLLNDHLPSAAVLIDEGVPADTTANLLSRLDSWLDSNSADVLIILGSTPDAYQSVGGFKNQEYVEADTLANVSAMIDMALGASMSVLIAAPPPVNSVCGNSGSLSCATIDARLASLATGLGTLASSKAVSFVDLYDAFISDARFSETPGDPNSLYLSDGLHPRYLTGDDLIASELADTLMSDMVVPEPSTGLLLAFGLGALAVVTKRGPQAV